VPPTAVFRCESSREVASGARDGLGSVQTDTRWCGWEERRPGVLITVGQSMSCQGMALADWRRWAASAARSKETRRDIVAVPVRLQGRVGVSSERAGQEECLSAWEGNIDTAHARCSTVVSTMERGR
jgi:hypothetical protein